MLYCGIMASTRQIGATEVPFVSCLKQNKICFIRSIAYRHVKLNRVLIVNIYLHTSKHAMYFLKNCAPCAFCAYVLTKTMLVCVACYGGTMLIKLMCNHSVKPTTCLRQSLSIVACAVAIIKMWSLSCKVLVTYKVTCDGTLL